MTNDQDWRLWERSILRDRNRETVIRAISILAVVIIVGVTLCFSLVAGGDTGWPSKEDCTGPAIDQPAGCIK